MASENPPLSRQRETLGLLLLFAVMYFVQGIAEPTEGLIAQPVPLASEIVWVLGGGHRNLRGALGDSLDD